MKERYGNRDQEVPPQGNQVPPQIPNNPEVGGFYLKEFRTSMNFLAQALMTQANMEVVANPAAGMSAYRIRDFLSMNPQEFRDSKGEKDPNRLIDEVYRLWLLCD